MILARKIFLRENITIIMAGNSQVGHIVNFNWNRFWPGDYINGEACEQRNTCHGDDPDLDSNAKWGIVNSETGRATTNYLDIAFITGVIRNYFNSFLNPEDNIVVNFIVKALSAASSTFEAKRDELMYKHIYGMGVENSLTPEEMNDHSEALHSNKIPYLDDWLENKKQESQYGERVVAKLGEYATNAARVKPVAHFIGGWLGNQYRTAIETILDLPARFYWRTRFFSGALHANFCTTVWDLITLKFKSLFSLGNTKELLNEKLQEVHQYSEDYFKNKYNGNYSTGGKSEIGLYLHMLKDRIKQHWKDIFRTKEVLKEKVDGGFIRTTEIPKKDSKESEKVPEISEATQFYQSITDFTAPFCAGLGLFATAVFDPLKTLWGVAGFERGKNLINTLSASRKTFQMINYFTRFAIPEYLDSLKFKDLEQAVKNGTANASEKMLYLARKERNANGWLGMLMSAGNILEPMVHLLRPAPGESKFANFMIDNFIKFNDIALVRFFSVRRKTRGIIRFLKTLCKLEDKKDFAELGYTEEALKQEAAKFYNSTNLRNSGILENIFSPVSNMSDRVKETINGTETVIKVVA